MSQVQLVITTDIETGATNVAGPIGNKALCYGMLEQARDAIVEFNRQQADKRVQLASGPLPPADPTSPFAK